MAQSVYGRGCIRSIGHLTAYGLIDSPTFTTPFFLFQQTRIDINKPRTRTIYITIAVSQVIPTLISNILDQEPGIIIKRDNTRSLLLRLVNHIAFTKENPSYIGPGNLKKRLLLRLFFSSRLSRKPIPSTTSLLSQYPQQLWQHPTTQQRQQHPPTYNLDTVYYLLYRSATSKITSTARPKRQRTLSRFYGLYKPQIPQPIL